MIESPNPHRHKMGTPTKTGVLGKDPHMPGRLKKQPSSTVIPLNDGHYTPPGGSPNVNSPFKDRLADK